MNSLAPTDDDCRSETYAEDRSPPLQEDTIEGCGEAPVVAGGGIGDRPDKDRFELRRNVGSGAFGDVHEGFCRLTRTRVAVKLARLSGVPGAARDATVEGVAARGDRGGGLVAHVGKDEEVSGLNS